MNQVTDTWYVLVDGTHADPSEVETDKDGVLHHKNGVAVALRENGLPLTSGVATKSNKKAADAGRAAAGKAGAEKSAADAADVKAKPKDERELKPGEGAAKKYETR